VAVALTAGVVAYDVKPSTKGGKIKGRVHYKGDSSKANQMVKPDKDTTVCSEHTNPELESKDGGLKNCTVYLKKIDAGKAWPDSMKKALIDNAKCVFMGNVTFVMKGGEVEFKNSDTVLHNVKASSANYNFNEGIEAGASLKKKCDKKDEVKISCSVHPWMSGTLWVVDHPYYVATNDRGEFELSDVPPGKYTLMAKHGKLGKPNKAEKGIAVEVKEGGEVSQDFEFN
jgi:plastocyanin